MSTDDPLGTARIGDVFSTPRQPARCYRIVREILQAALLPESALEPPRPVDLSLGEGLAGRPVEAVLKEVQEKVAAGAVNVRHELAMAHMTPPPMTVSVLADLIIGALNQCSFIWEEAPLAAELEREVLRWFAARVGFEEGFGGLITSGGTMSNYLAVFLASQHARKNGTLVGNSGSIIASDQSHLSLEKAAALTGLGRDAVVRAKSEDGRLTARALGEAISTAHRRGRPPFIIVCTAGTTNAGVLEPAEEAVEEARRNEAWCHIDAAHGGFVSLLPEYTTVWEHWRQADSLSWDAHKTLYASYAAGVLLLRSALHGDELVFRSDYAFKPGSRDDPGAHHIDGSRRLEALKLWMCIRHLGVEGFREIARHSIQRARDLADAVRRRAELALVTDPDTNVVCFRFVDARLSAEELGEVNALIQARLFRTGGPLLSTTRLGEATTLRAVVLNPRLRKETIESVLDAVVEQGRLLSSRLLLSRPPVGVVAVGR